MSDLQPSQFATPGNQADTLPEISSTQSPTGTGGRSATANNEGESILGAEERVVADEEGQGVLVTTLATTGPPTTGTWKAGQVVEDASGVAWNCTAGGEPGTWAQSVLVPSKNLSDLASASTALGNLGGAPLVSVAALGTPGNSTGVQTIKEEPLNPIRYGAVGDGSTPDDSAFGDMITAAGGTAAEFYLPPRYNFLLSAAGLVIPPGSKVWGGGDSSVLTVAAGGGHLFTDTGGEWAHNHFHDFQVSMSSTSGDVFHQTESSMNRVTFDNLNVLQANPGAYVFNLLGANACVWEKLFLGADGARSVPIYQLITTGGNGNNNTLRDVTTEDFGTPDAYQFWIESQGGAIAGWLIENITGENPVAGLFNLLSIYHAKLDVITAWDLADTTTAHLVNVDTSSAASSPRSSAVEIGHYDRPSGTLGTSQRDINLSGSGAENCYIHDVGFGGGTDLSINAGITASSAGRGHRIERIAGSVANILGYVPIPTVGSAAGTGATASTVAQSGLWEGAVTVTTGSSPEAGTLVTLGFSSNGLYDTNAPVGAVLTPIGANAGALAAAGLTVASLSASAVVVQVTSALAADTTYTVAYHIIGALPGR